VTTVPSPARRRTRRPRAEREAAILEAARAVFAERGYGEAAVAEIAARTGVVEGTVYSYFPTKRALLIAVMRLFYDDLISETASGLEAELNRRYTGLASKVLERGVASGELRDDIVPSVIRDLIYGGIEHAVWRFVFTDGRLELGPIADQLADAILGGILSRQAAASREDTVRRLERAVARLESHVGQAEA
jgi:AcrR family transcriptional regulator